MAYTAPNGVTTVPGVPDDAGSRDPSATSPGAAVDKAMAQSAAMESDTFGQGTYVGDLIDLPPNTY